jgi:hypothetical protein
MVFQFLAAADVNPMQALSQFKLRKNVSTGNNYIGITMSPSGSWHGWITSGSTITSPGFTDPTSEVVASSWTASDTSGYVTLIGSQYFLILNYKSNLNAGASGFHIEIPQRLYPQGDDPNPVTVMTYASTGIVTSTANSGYGGGFYMHNPPDGSTMLYYGFVRRWFGDDTNTAINQTNGRYNGSFFNTYQGKFLFSNIILGQPTIATQYQLARVALRRVRILPTILPQFERVGNNGEWLYMQNGVMWPWDNSLLPYNLLLGGN